MEGGASRFHGEKKGLGQEKINVACRGVDRIYMALEVSL